MELIDRAGRTTVETQAVLASKIAYAQEIIAGARLADEQAQKNAVEEAIQHIYPYPPREGQRDALWQLIYQQKDLILIAKTSFGKSMILQAVSILLKKTMTVVVLPLDRIGQEQAEYITNIGGRPCFLNADTINKKILEDVKNGLYTHLLISPELATGPKFHTTATDPLFKEQLGLVVLDEAHLVSQWGRSFRTAYARIGVLRSLFGSHIPWFACSATLNTQALDEVKRAIGFDKNVTVIRTSVDRPEIALRMGIIPRNQKKSASALRFLLDDAVRANNKTPSCMHLVPKTVVFFDSKKVAYSTKDQLRMWLQMSDNHLYSEAQSSQVVVVFHRELAKADKEAIITEFQQPDSRIRILLATEAIGIGVNLPDVRRVVLNGLPKDDEPAIPWQRGGRAGRDGGSSEMIILLEHWVKGTRKPSSASQVSQQRNRQSSWKAQALDGASDSEDSSDIEEAGDEINTRMADEERRSKLPDFWYLLANDEGCLRHRFLQEFNEPPEFSTDIRRCCSNCNPNELALGPLDKHYLYHERGPRLTARHKRMLAHLTAWCERQLPTVFPNPSFRPIADCFLPKDQLTRIVKDQTAAINLSCLRTVLGPWHYLEEYGEALWKELDIATTREAAATPHPRLHGNQTIPEIWTPVTTPMSMSQSTPVQRSTPLQYSLSLSPLQVSANAPVMRGPSRQALGDISGNVPNRASKRLKRTKDGSKCSLLTKYRRHPD